MIKGIGIDIIEIKRIDKAIKKNNRFLDKLFTKNEQLYFKSNNYLSNTIAGTFAAKEAIVKSMGTGVRGFSWKDVEVNRDELGKPNVVLYGKAKEMANDNNINEILISISHCKEYAVAEAIAQ